MNIYPITHHGEERLCLEFPYDQKLIHKVRQIQDASWSRSLKAWHIPNDANSIKQLSVLFPDTEIASANSKADKEPELNEVTAPAARQASQQVKRPIKVEVAGRKILITMPKNQDDIKFILQLRYSKWNSIHRIWEVPDYPGNIDLIKDYFKERMDDVVYHESFDINISNESRTVSRNEVFVFKTRMGRLRVVFGFDNELRKLIKTFPFSSWDNKNKWWTIPYSEIYLTKIQKFATEKGLQFRYEEEPVGEPGVKRITPFDIANYRTCPESMVLKLKELRYSESTLKTYKNLFEEFINYYAMYEINSITEQQIIAFLRFLVMERKVSGSYQNQAINAIKFYYEKVLGGQRKFYFIDRPKKERSLPTVLNTEETLALFDAAKNIKHKCAFMLAYSTGMRVGEVINLKLSHIDRERMQIRVVSGKGKKDRVTTLARKFLKTLDQYLEEYHPKEYLFEGEKGGQYTASSLQTVIKEISAKAKITKKVTMHTLRHTFGTHSLEGGTDLRYIQDMMGHETSKTTEIYTHITTKGFDQIKSPLDNLDF